MTIYIVVEGVVGEARVYEKWVQFVNPSLRLVPYVSDITDNSFCIVSGGGHPSYYDVIEAAMIDVTDYGVNRLVVAVDSEEMSFQEKYKEIEDFVGERQSTCTSEVRIVIQHFCLEAWALGNKKAVKQNPHGTKLIEYKEFYDVRTRDPELLPGYPPEKLNRAQFAEKYLKKALNEHFRTLTYSKSNPKALLHPSYYSEVRKRFETTSHIDSFKHFLRAFV